jgi:hypothetical protein
MTLLRCCYLLCPFFSLLLSYLRYSEMNEFDRWKCIQDRERAAEVAELARVRVELKAKLETALLIAKLQRMCKS